MKLSRYAKGITTLVGTFLTVLIQQNPNASWIPYATAGATVLATIAVPNAISNASSNQKGIENVSPDNRPV